jgi:hypothetical protein
VTGFAARTPGRVISYEKTSDQPPENRTPLKPRVAIKLDTRLLDACVGRYEFPSDAVPSGGFKLTIWRDGDQLVARAQGARCVRYLSTVGDILRQNERCAIASLTAAVGNAGGSDHPLYREVMTPFYIRLSRITTTQAIIFCAIPNGYLMTSNMSFDTTELSRHPTGRMAKTCRGC